MIGSGPLSIVLFTLSALSALFFFVLAFVFFARGVLNVFFSLFLVAAGIVTLGFSFDYAFIQALRSDSGSSAYFNFVSFCVLAMLPLYYLSVRKFVDKPFSARDIPSFVFGAAVICFSLAVGWPPERPVLGWARWFSLLAFLILLCASSFRLLAGYGREEADESLYEGKTLTITGAVSLAMTVASSFAELTDPRYGLALVSVTMSGSLFAFLVFVLIRSPELLRRSKAKYADSVLDAAAATELFAKIDRLVREEKAYRKFGFSLSELSRSLRVNARYASQAINQTTGKSFSRYVNDYRLEEARRMLEETDANATDIGFSVGFNSLSSFYDQFKKAHKATPEQYRKNGR